MVLIPDYFASLQSSFWFMVVIQTIGSVDMPGRGPRKMPSPRAYAAIIVAWGVLQVVADTGKDRAASAFGWAIVFAGLVLGPFSRKLTGLFTSVANSVATPNQTG